MKLRLYSSATKNFNNNGLGSLNDAFNATVKEEANGELTLTFSYPVNGKRFSDLINDNIVVAKPNATDADHAFRIINTVPDFSGMYNTVIAVSITNDIAGVPVANFSRVDKGKDIANAINTSYTFPTGLSLTSDVTTSGKVENSFTNLLALIAGSENSLLTAVGGELKRTNQGLQLLTRRGRDYPVKFSLHKNINGIKITTDTSSVITGILPYVTYSDSDQKEVVIIGDVIKAGNASDYAVQKIQPTAIPSRRSTDTTSSTDQSLPIVENKTQLMTAATAYYKGTSFVNSSYPTVTVEIDVASVQNSTEYKQFTNITDIGLFDTVKVDLSEYGLSYDMKVSDVQYDPIEERVVSVTLGKNKKTFTSSINSQIAKNTQSIDNVTTIVTNTATTIDGKNSVTWGNVRPSNPLEGDTWFQRDGDYSATWVYGNGQWNQVTDSDTQAKIKEGVDLAIETANQNTDTAIEQNNASQQVVMNDIAKSQADLAIKDGDFNNKAQAMADKALSDAKANTATVSQETLNTANQNLAAAKSDLTDGLQKEVSDRNSAVSALDTKAQGYVNAAKTDVLETVSKEITDRQNAVSALDTKATNAVNQAKSDINDTINALSVGGRNYLLNSNGSTLDKWTPVNGWSIISDADRGNVFTFTPTTSWTGGSTNSLSQTRTDFPTDKTVTVSFWAKASVDGAKFHSEPTGGTAADNTLLNVSLKTNWQRYSYTFYLSSARIYFVPVDSGVTYWVDDLQLEIGNMISDYSQAPEDIVYDYTDKDNQIKQTFTQYQQSNDGNVSKAQTDATQALGLVATKVSQTDYDTKTGDLTTKYTQVKQTTDSQAADIVDIKETATSQASKINSISSDVDGTKQSISDIETTQDSQSDKINQITTDVNGTKQSITDIQTKDGQQDTRMGTIETSVSGVKSDFSTYKADANGRIGTAQTTAQTAVDGLKNKVSQTDYNTKTGQLQTDLTTTTQTANQAKIDIVSIKQTDTSQDSRMNTIESDANGTKQTVSNIQTAQGKQSGDISTLQQRADGFDATVTKVNNLAVGGRNLLINTSNTQSGYLVKFANTSVVSGTTQKITFPSVGETCITKSTTGETYYRFNVPTSGNMVNIVAGKSYTFSADIVGNVPYLALRHQNQSGGASWTGDFKSDLGVTTTYKRVSITFTVPTNATGFYLSLQAYSDSALTNTTITDAQYFSFKRVKFEEGTIATSYEYAPEDVDSATAKAQLTADQATTSLNSYKADADGRISKAQSDIIQTAKDVTTKVSQSDYNSKTSELTTKVSTAQQTADSAVTTIGSYKTSNDNRVAAAETKISQNANDITLRATTSDLNAAKSDYTAQIAQVKVDAQAVTTTVSQIQTTVNKLNQNNLVNNSQLNPDYSGWHVTSPWGKSVTTELWNNGVESSTGAMWVWHDQSKSGEWIYSDPVAVLPGLSLSASITAAMPSPPSSGTPLALCVYTYDANKTRIDSFGLNINYSMVNGTFKKFNLDNNVASSGAKYASVVFGWNVGGQISFGKPMLMFGATTGDYVAGPYNNNDKVSSLQVSLDGITSTVSKTTSDVSSLTTRVQTAEGTLSTATDNISGLQSKQTQTANQVTQEITDRANGDSNTLQSSKDFTQSSITSAVNGVNSTISQTASGILAQVDTMNMVTNSEFDPTNVGWYVMSNAVGSGLGNAWNAPTTSAFVDWPVVGGSRLILYNVGTWYTSELRTSSAGKVYSASIIAGRSAVPAQSTALDFRIGFWDSGKKLLGTVSAGNIIDGAAYKGMAKYSIENKTAPTGTAYVSVIIAHSGAASDIIGRPMLSSGATAVPYTPTTATTSSSTIISLFKDNWSIGISDNIGNITSGIVGNSNSMSVISDNITLKGTTTVTGEFFARGGSFTNLNASNMTTGTLNANLVNVTNLNASNIVTGTITGASLMIDLTSGQVQFQKGRIFSSDYKIDINIDQGYISTANDNTRALIKQGMIQLIDPTLFSPQTNPYLEISNYSSALSGASALIKARDSLVVSMNGYDDRSFGVPITDELFVGLSIGKINNKLIPTKIGGASQGVIISGGQRFTTGGMVSSPYIYVGSDSGGGGNGDRVFIEANYLHSRPTYQRTTSSSANVYVSQDGALVRSSSSSKYKLDIEYEKQADTANRLLTLDPATWHDKFESEQLDKFHEIGAAPERLIDMSHRRYYGIIAEDLVKAGLEQLVSRNVDTGEVEGVEYSKIGVALIPIIRDLRNKLNEQAVEIERLKDKNK